MPAHPSERKTHGRITSSPNTTSRIQLALRRVPAGSRPDHRGPQSAELITFDIAAETIEGTPPGGQTVILKFEDTAAARAWYESPEYQAVVGKRLEATEGFAIISHNR